MLRDRGAGGPQQTQEGVSGESGRAGHPAREARTGGSGEAEQQKCAHSQPRVRHPAEV